MDWRYWGQKWLGHKVINCLCGALKILKDSILWIEGTEDKNNLDINWSTASVGGFKRLILWIEGTEDKNDLDIK